MSVVQVTEQETWESLLRIWRDLDVPEGWRPELTVEGIVVTPPPGGPHNLIAAYLHRALLPVVPAECEVFQTQSVGVIVVGGIYIPDLCVIPRSVIPPDSDPVPADEVLLAVEITSRSNAEHDRKKKKWAYAHGGIPQYLLIDRFDEEGPAVSLYSGPRGGNYHRIQRVPFGEPIHLDPPFELTLDTQDF